MTDNKFEIKPMDLIEIERRARAMQSRAMFDMFSALRAAIVARFHRAPSTHSA